MSEEAMTQQRAESIADEVALLALSGDYSLILRRSAQLAERAKWSLQPQALACDLGVIAGQGAIAAMVAIECLAEVDHRAASEQLVDLLWHESRIVRRHAAWRLGSRGPTPRAIPELVRMVTSGGIDTMHAQRTLHSWSQSDARSIILVAADSLVSQSDAAARARLVDLLGLMGRPAEGVLLAVAQDTDEAVAVRAGAIGALGELGGSEVDAILRRLARSDESVAIDAAMALGRRGFDSQPSRDNTTERGGLRVAQLVLSAGLDGQLSLGGRGDTGGVASLLVSVGEALARRAEIGHVLTIGRGTVADAFTGPLSSSRIPLSYGAVAFGDETRRAETPDDSWEQLPTIKRGIRRILRIGGPIDVLHLRMADAGTLAGAEVAAAAGISVCFSVAPDPHNVIDSLQTRGELDDETFIGLVTQTNLWFRARLVEKLARESDQLALFPRSNQIHFLEELNIDVTGATGEAVANGSQRVAVVAEGIDVAMLDRAAQIYSIEPAGGRHGGVLDELAERIPNERRGLPLLLSVGRLNPVKGMDRVVSAWASSRQLRETCNLVIVGGDLTNPTSTERAVLEAIDTALPLEDPNRPGLILMGGRPRAEVASLLVAAALGRSDAWAAGGVYVDGAIKEEFGLAVLEALAAGLVVVAPSTGGPSTYVDHGENGILVDPGADLGLAVSDAFGLVDRPGRARRAHTMVENRYSIDAMAAQLLGLYRPAMAMQ